MEEKPPATVDILEREKYHSMLNMEVIGDPDVVIIDNDKEYEDPTKIFVKSRVTVCKKKQPSLHCLTKRIPCQICMLTLSVVTLSVCLFSVIAFVGVEEAVESDSALYVLGKF